jgi:hypothetical protein
MAAPPCARLAADLTSRILEEKHTDDIPVTQYQGYIWVMHVLLTGGWIDLSPYPRSAELLSDVGMLEVLKPWLESTLYSQDDITAMLVARELFTTSG